MAIFKHLGMLIGRLCICAIFLGSGINKIMDWDGVVQYMSNEGMTNIPLFLTLAIVCELLGGIFVLLGYWTRFGAFILLVFLGVVTYIFHDFWLFEGLAQVKEQVNFMKNLAIFGGVIYLLSAGPGKISVDGVRGKAD